MLDLKGKADLFLKDGFVSARQLHVAAPWSLCCLARPGRAQDML